MDNTPEQLIAIYTEQARGRMVDTKDRLLRSQERLAKVTREDYPQGILEEVALMVGRAKDYKQACDHHRNWQCIPQVMLRKELALLK